MAKITEEEFYGNARQRKRKRLSKEGPKTFTDGEKKAQAREEEKPAILSAVIYVEAVEGFLPDER